MTGGVIDYGRPGRLTSFSREQHHLLDELPADPVGVCAAVQQLVIQPGEAAALGLPEARSAERGIRPAGGLVDVLAGLGSEPLDRPRPPESRVVGTSRHYAVLATALLRFRGIPARARCGFATYFVPGSHVDHWIVEHLAPGASRWTRIDAEILGRGLVGRPDDLAEGEFLTGGEAWVRCRRGAADPDTFGVAGVDHAWGIGEVRGNAIRDLAALCKLEMLPWDEWGRMDDSYQGRTGPEYDRLMDDVAGACASDDPQGIASTYGREDLAVPDHLIP